MIRNIRGMISPIRRVGIREATEYKQVDRTNSRDCVGGLRNRERARCMPDRAVNHVS